MLIQSRITNVSQFIELRSAKVSFLGITIIDLSRELHRCIIAVQPPVSCRISAAQSQSSQKLSFSFGFRFFFSAWPGKRGRECINTRPRGPNYASAPTLNAVFMQNLKPDQNVRDLQGLARHYVTSESIVLLPPHLTASSRQQPIPHHHLQHLQHLQPQPPQQLQQQQLQLAMEGVKEESGSGKKSSSSSSYAKHRRHEDPDIQRQRVMEAREKAREAKERRRHDPEYRQRERERDREAKRLARSDPLFRQRERERDREAKQRKRGVASTILSSDALATTSESPTTSNESMKNTNAAAGRRPPIDFRTLTPHPPPMGHTKPNGVSSLSMLSKVCIYLFFFSQINFW